VVAVVDEVGSEGASSSEAINTWIQLVGSLSATFASISDAVVEVTSGIPTYVKGEPWWS
jgi:adenosyl cobinamide kinase/adenosyl cobinamide phosphate guanylyltransferase